MLYKCFVFAGFFAAEPVYYSVMSEHTIDDFGQQYLFVFHKNIYTWYFKILQISIGNVWAKYGENVIITNSKYI